MRKQLSLSWNEKIFLASNFKTVKIPPTRVKTDRRQCSRCEVFLAQSFFLWDHPNLETKKKFIATSRDLAWGKSSNSSESKLFFSNYMNYVDFINISNNTLFQNASHFFWVVTRNYRPNRKKHPKIFIMKMTIISNTRICIYVTRKDYKFLSLRLKLPSVS